MIHFATLTLALLAAAAAVSAHGSDADPSNTTEVPMTGSHLTTRIVANKQAYVNVHNKERAAHGAKALTWDDGLSASAQAWANKCRFKASIPNYQYCHSQPGENLAAGTGNPSIATAIGWWNAERKNYDPSSPQPSHWTQVVWKSTKKVGCALAKCPPGSVLNPKYG
ncbi:hypothetical protein FRC06_009787, partial [Ceratobasidium sp. 370]